VRAESNETAGRRLAAAYTRGANCAPVHTHNKEMVRVRVTRVSDRLTVRAESNETAGRRSVAAYTRGAGCAPVQTRKRERG